MKATRKFKKGDTVLIIKLISASTKKDVSGSYPGVVGSLGTITDLYAYEDSQEYEVKPIDDHIRKKHEAFALLEEEMQLIEVGGGDKLLL
jgi:hypothetical protein